MLTALCPVKAGVGKPSPSPARTLDIDTRFSEQTGARKGELEAGRRQLESALTQQGGVDGAAEPTREMVVARAGLGQRDALRVCRQ